jgi:hypothetical protein
MPESPEEKEALAKLDEETRDVAWDEFDKEADRELSVPLVGGGLTLRGPGPLGWFFGRLRPFRWKKGDPVPEPVDDPDPTDERGLRDVLDDDPKT